MKALAIILIVLVVVAAVVGPQTLFVVDETNTAVVTRFGEPLRSITSPGLYVKTPFVERTVYFDKRLLVFDAPADSLLTKDKKNSS
jgi:membrane protease subunit HflC